MKESAVRRNSIAILMFSATIAVALYLTGQINFHTNSKNVPPEKDQRSFFENTVIRLIVPNNPGGGYDEYGRLIAGFIEKYTGARVQLINMPGSGGMRALGELFKAPADGLTLGLLNGSGIVSNQVAATRQLDFEVDQLSFLGRVTRDIRVLAVSTQSGYTSFSDILNAEKALRFGATGFGGSTYVDAVLSRHMFGLNVDVIHGFNNSSATRIAMLRGNIDGTWSSLGSVQEEVASGQLRLVLQLGERRHADLRGVPAIIEFKDNSKRPDLMQERLRAWSDLHNIGRTLAAPPGVAPARLAFLREAFRQAMQDREFLGRAASSGRQLDYASSEEMEEIVGHVLQVSPEIQAVFAEAMRSEL